MAKPKSSRRSTDRRPIETPVIPIPDSMTYGELPRFWGCSHLALGREYPVVFFEIGDAEGWPHTPTGHEEAPERMVIIASRGPEFPSLIAALRDVQRRDPHGDNATAIRIDPPDSLQVIFRHMAEVDLTMTVVNYVELPDLFAIFVRGAFAISELKKVLPQRHPR